MNAGVHSGIREIDGSVGAVERTLFDRRAEQKEGFRVRLKDTAA
jgi:hypothetical protein